MALTATSPHQQSNSAAVLAGSCQPRPLILLAKCPEFRQNPWRKCNWDCVLPAAQNTAGYVFIWKPLSAKLASCTPRRGQPPLMDRLLVQLRKLLSGLQYPVLAFCPKSVVQISGLAWAGKRKNVLSFPEWSGAKHNLLDKGANANGA